MSAELEEARALGELVKQRLAAEADDRLCRVGRRRAGAARLDRMGRAPRAGAARQGGGLHQHRRQRPRLPRRRRFACARGARQQRGARHRGSRDEEQSCGSGCRRGRSRTAPPGPRAEVRARADLRIGALGSGSDYSPFLQHAGIPSLNLAFGGLDDADGIYHSIYDDYYHFTKFLDTDFAYGRALAQTVGTLVIRLADADVMPFQFTTSPTRCRPTSRAAGAAEGSGRTRTKSATGRSKTVCSRRLPIRAGRCRRRRSRTCRRRSISRRSRTPPAALTRAAERYRKALERSRDRS